MNDETRKPGSEAELIDEFRKIFRADDPPTDLLLGIGDDAAAFEPGVDPDSKFVVTADMLVEDVHFTLKTHSLYDIGYRTAVANISDIAAMGAQPRWGVATVAVPSDLSRKDILDLARGLGDPMSKFDARIIGGDMTSSPDRMSLSMTIIGETSFNLAIRSGAKLGDSIAVTGSLGKSGAGLSLLLDREIEVPESVREYLVDTHHKPVPRVMAGKILANLAGIHSMMDISDGLGIDIGRICAASNVGCRIWEEQIPISNEVLAVAEAIDRDHLDFVNSGEDFELLITGDEKAIELAVEVFRDNGLDLDLSIIGEIIDQPFGMHIARVDGSVVNPASLGWDHFSRKE